MDWISVVGDDLSFGLSGDCRDSARVMSKWRASLVRYRPSNELAADCQDSAMGRCSSTEVCVFRILWSTVLLPVAVAGSTA